MVSCKNLSFTYPGQEAPALANISLDILPGQFVILCGKSGCGKTTFLRQWKLPAAGKKTGDVFYNRTLIEKTPPEEIGFLFQKPEHQIVTDRVWHELAFGLENLGLPKEEIRLRVAETAQFFGLQQQFGEKISRLSGGQKQLLNLAAIMAMRPKVLLLDEPTAQLDPIAKERFLDEIKRINQELGVTVVMSEHNLEKSMSLCDRIIVMDEGKIVADDAPRYMGHRIKNQDIFALMPTPTQVQLAVTDESVSPITIKEGKEWLETHVKKREIHISSHSLSQNYALEGKHLYFRYEKEGKDILKDFSISIPEGSIYAILGENGSGKSTALSLLSGIHRPMRGKIMAESAVRYLPQDPQTVFLKNTLEEDLKLINQDISEVVALTGLKPLLKRHPYDLSIGEQQRAALAKLLLTQPKILLLDEPTKGLDALFQKELVAILRNLAKSGVTIIIASHNLEFCASVADQCGLLFDGSLISQGKPHAFFSQMEYYTTAAHKLAGDYCKSAITAEEVISLCL